MDDFYDQLMQGKSAQRRCTMPIYPFSSGGFHAAPY